MDRNRVFRIVFRFVGLVALCYPVAVFGQTSPQPGLRYAQAANGCTGQPFGTPLGSFPTVSGVAAYSNCNPTYDPVIISAATNTNPVVFTAANHGLGANGIQQITIYGATGNWTPVNHAHTVTVIDNNTFSIPVNATAFGALTGTLTGDYDNPLGTGLEWQCVEFARRYWFTVYSTDVGLLSGLNADEFYSSAPQRGLLQYQNGTSTTPPQVGDILASQGPAGSNGHVAIVSSVSSSQVCAVMQNWSESSSDIDGSHCMTMMISASKYTVNGFHNESPQQDSYPIQGWLP